VVVVGYRDAVVLVLVLGCRDAVVLVLVLVLAPMNDRLSRGIP
jgi:hypothetical protein